MEEAAGIGVLQTDRSDEIDPQFECVAPSTVEYMTFKCNNKNPDFQIAISVLHAFADQVELRPEDSSKCVLFP